MFDVTIFAGVALNKISQYRRARGAVVLHDIVVSLIRRKIKRAVQFCASSSRTELSTLPENFCTMPWLYAWKSPLETRMGHISLQKGIVSVEKRGKWETTYKGGRNRSGKRRVHRQWQKIPSLCPPVRRRYLLLAKLDYIWEREATHTIMRDTFVAIGYHHDDGCSCSVVQVVNFFANGFEISHLLTWII
jgi:hypothetical protein